MKLKIGWHNDTYFKLKETGGNTMKPKKYATCEFCNQEMIPGGACTFTKGIDKDKKVYDRIPYGQETRYAECGSELWPPKEGEHCHDCNVAVGAIHHDGCDMEECPVCHLQMLGCECLVQLAKV